MAQAYVKQCKFEHNKNRGRFGENLAAGAGDFDHLVGTQSRTRRHAHEVRDYMGKGDTQLNAK